MLSYKDFIFNFGFALEDAPFTAFLEQNLSSIQQSTASNEFIVSEELGLELGFTALRSWLQKRKTAVPFSVGLLVFSHVNIFSRCKAIELPFGVNFEDNREAVQAKAGKPLYLEKSKHAVYHSLSLDDNYKIGNHIFTFSYRPNGKTLSFIQIRDNNLVLEWKL